MNYQSRLRSGQGSKEQNEARRGCLKLQQSRVRKSTRSYWTGNLSCRSGLPQPAGESKGSPELGMGMTGFATSGFPQRVHQPVCHVLTHIHLSWSLTSDVLQLNLRVEEKGSHHSHTHMYRHTQTYSGPLVCPGHRGGHSAQLCFIHHPTLAGGSSLQKVLCDVAASSLLPPPWPPRLR